MKTTLISKYPVEISKLFYYFKSLDISEVGNNYKTFSHFIDCIKKYSENISNDENIQKKFKGDILEVFAEIFFTCFENDPEIGLKNYTPISIDSDYGCDAFGLNAAGQKCAVQVKFRNNPLDSVTYEELAKTDVSARRLLNVNTSLHNSIFLFTSAYDISNSAKIVLDKSLVVIDKNKISYKIDNNISFWDKAWEIIKEHK